MERDEAIGDRHKTLNNTNVAEYAYDEEVRWGGKGKNKHWFGYKNAIAINMRGGIITKLEVDPGNVTDTEMFFNVCPERGAV